jgi:hypothetical protein
VPGQTIARHTAAVGLLHRPRRQQVGKITLGASLNDLKRAILIPGGMAPAATGPEAITKFWEGAIKVGFKDYSSFSLLSGHPAGRLVTDCYIDVTAYRRIDTRPHYLRKNRSRLPN